MNVYFSWRYFFHVSFAVHNDFVGKWLLKRKRTEMDSKHCYRKLHMLQIVDTKSIEHRRVCVFSDYLRSFSIAHKNTINLPMLFSLFCPVLPLLASSASCFDHFFRLLGTVSCLFPHLAVPIIFLLRAQLFPLASTPSSRLLRLPAGFSPFLAQSAAFSKTPFPS